MILIQLINNMTTRLYGTVTPGTRDRSLSDFNGGAQSHPQKKLTSGRHRCGKGRNDGIITTRHRGGGHKRLYRQIDFRRSKKDISGEIVTRECDPSRSAYIRLVHYRDDEKTSILHPRGVMIGDTIISGPRAPISMGNALPSSAV